LVREHRRCFGRVRCPVVTVEPGVGAVARTELLGSVPFIRAIEFAISWERLGGKGE
jgi:hypothetical protein